MRYLLTLGVFDDGDVEPTIVLTAVEEAELIPVDELRAAAVHEYGRNFPTHAEFWSCAPEPS